MNSTQTQYDQSNIIYLRVIHNGKLIIMNHIHHLGFAIRMSNDLDSENNQSTYYTAPACAQSSLVRVAVEPTIQCLYYTIGEDTKTISAICRLWGQTTASKLGAPLQAVSLSISWNSSRIEWSLFLSKTG